MASIPAPSSSSSSGPGGLGLAAVLAAALLSAALILYAVGDLNFAIAFLAGTIGIGGLLLLRARLATRGEAAEAVPRADVALLRAALDCCSAAIAITEPDGSLVCANESYSERFGAQSPPTLGDGEERQALETALGELRRTGTAQASVTLAGLPMRVSLRPGGFGDTHILWRFESVETFDPGAEARGLIAGPVGDRLGEAGLMVALCDREGKVISANRVFCYRATGDPDAAMAGTSLVRVLASTEEGSFTFAGEGKGAQPLRIIQIPVGDGPDPVTFFLFLDEAGFGSAGRGDAGNVQTLLDILPLGLALASNDGRFVYLNKVFRKAAGLSKEAKPVYPGDLLVDEDKAAVSDTVWRLARGPAMSTDISVRLRTNPEEPVALTIAGARGLGEAAVLLSLKDNKEEDRLKRQVAQATKMQAIGQLAGGVAHDFNNILTAIIGYCDLMLMRHTPGDSDYDDIQQIRSNSNRAASLTRQLLAFSRQQTLRPQVVQLPDIIAEVSTLLKRLLGEHVKLQVKHDRNLGSVRADPGQLEQVIVNLAVNARDAMPEGGTLTLHTFAVTADDVRRMGSDILPVGEYTALRVSDTGTGIAPHLLTKVFEPFFTTKEVGKGTGLGLSTVYGIVKQSGGFIFAESEVGEGTSFTVYLPVHRAEAPKKPTHGKEDGPAGELWGTGTILLVEDETMVRAVAERALTRQGYTVFTAENGEAALEILAREEKIDLMVSDVVMPTMDGPTTAREARKNRPDLPILFISGYAEEQLRKSIDIERVSFLAKPFSVQKLAEAVRDTLAGK